MTDQDKPAVWEDGDFGKIVRRGPAGTWQLADAAYLNTLEARAAQADALAEESARLRGAMRKAMELRMLDNPDHLVGVPCTCGICSECILRAALEAKET